MVGQSCLAFVSLKHLTNKLVIGFAFLKYSVNVLSVEKAQSLLSGVEASVSPFTCCVISTSCSSFLSLVCKVLTDIPVCTVVRGTCRERAGKVLCTCKFYRNVGRVVE